MGNIRTDVQKLEVDHVVQLFELDCRSIGGDIYRFHNEATKPGAVVGDLAFGGLVYYQRPIIVEGIEISSTGQKPRPKMTIANLEGLISGLILNLDDLLGARLTRIRTLAKYLDGGAEANPGMQFPVDSFYVIQKESETHQKVQFVLGDPSELLGVTAPRRKVNATTCITEYRGEVCQYAGDPIQELDGTAIAGPFVDRGDYDQNTTYAAKDMVTVTDPDGTPHKFVARHTTTGVPPNFTANWAADRCSKKFSRCKITHSAPYPFDAWPAAARLPS